VHNERLLCTLMVLAFMLFMFGVTTAQTKLTWATWGPTHIDKLLIDAFTEENPDIQIEYIQTGWAEHHSKLKILSAAGHAPDVMLVDGYYTAEFAESELIQPIDKYIENDPDLDMDDYLPIAVLDVQYNGHYYGLPWGSAPIYYVINITHMEQSGLGRPDLNWTQETWVDYLRKLTVRDTDGTVSRYGDRNPLVWDVGVFPWLWAAGARMFNEDRTKFLLTEPEAVKALQQAADLHLVHDLVAPGWGSFESEKVSMTCTFPSEIVGMQRQDLSFEWDVTLYPAGEAGSFTVWKGNLMTISPQSKHPEESWKFLEFLLGPDSKGHEIFVRHQRFAPQTRDPYLWEIYHDPTKAPVSLREVTLVMGSKYSKTLPYIKNWQEVVFGVVKEAINKIRTGEQPASTAVKAIAPVVEEMLRER